MIVKCPTHGVFSHGPRGSRPMCPHCLRSGVHTPLGRPNADELQQAIDQVENVSQRADALVGISRVYDSDSEHDRALRLAGFMSVFHGVSLTQHEAQSLLRE